MSVQKQNNAQKREQGRFEFTLYLNDNIIVQRFFNVIGFNEKAVRSLNFKEVVDNNADIIKAHLRDHAIDFMTANYMMYENDPSYDQKESNDVIKMVVRMDGNVLAYREWDASIYPASVRYKVNVKNHIYEMITSIQKCLSDKSSNLTTSYLGYSLI